MSHGLFGDEPYEPAGWMGLALMLMVVAVAAAIYAVVTLTLWAVVALIRLCDLLLDAVRIVWPW